MVLIALLYGGLVYLLFFKFSLLPWNKISQGLTLLIGVIILTGFLVGLQGLTPASVQAEITGKIVEIAPQVSGRVIEVRAEPTVMVDEGTILFTIDPVLFEARVQDLQARLELARLRLQQYAELAAASAGTKFQLQQTEAEVKQLSAQLVAAEFDLNNTVVRAPSRGKVPAMVLDAGMQVSPSRAVLTFVDTSNLVVMALFQQKALQNVRIGDKALVNFPALPGQVFEAAVLGVPSAIGDAQLIASGQLTVIQQVQVTRLYPVAITLPDDFPDDLRKVGLAATVYIHTEGEDSPRW